MAKEKKSFILYADLIHTVKKMKAEDAGELFLHILKYVNDEDPETENMLVDLTFEPIKQQFKRDLQKWEATIEQRSEAGKASAEARRLLKLNQQPLTPVEIVERNSTNPTVSDTVTVTVTVNDNVNDNVIKMTIEERKLKFASTLKIFIEEFGKDLVNDFYKYWTEPNRSNTKFKQEMEKTWDARRRIEKWSSNNFNQQKPKTNGTATFAKNR